MGRQPGQGSRVYGHGPVRGTLLTLGYIRRRSTGRHPRSRCATRRVRSGCPSLHAVARSVRFLRGARSDRENPNRYVLQSHDACTTECPAPTARRPALNANLVYSKFLFVTLRREDTRARATLREAGSCIARGFFNDFHATGSPNPRSNETVQFLVAATPAAVQRRPAVGRVCGARDHEVSATAGRDRSGT